MSAAAFDLAGAVRRIRRCADCSQRELAVAIGTSKSTIAGAETGAAGLDARLLAAAAHLAGLRLALLDALRRQEVRGMHPDAVRDRGGRRFPAHLDTVLSEERASRWEHRPRLRQPTYTFDRRDPWADASSRVTEPARRPPPAAAGRLAGGAGRRRGRLAARDGAGTRRGRMRLATGALRAGGHALHMHLPARVRRARRLVRAAGARRSLPVLLRRGLTRCYRGPVRGSLLLTRRGEALS